MGKNGDGIVKLKAVGDIALFKSIQKEIQVNGNYFISEKNKKNYE